MSKADMWMCKMEIKAEEAKRGVHAEQKKMEIKKMEKKETRKKEREEKTEQGR